MADISNVKEEEIRNLYQSLEELSCRSQRYIYSSRVVANASFSLHSDKSSILTAPHHMHPESLKTFCTIYLICDLEVSTHSSQRRHQKSIQHGVHVVILGTVV
jgi:thymidylate kinase